MGTPIQGSPRSSKMYIGTLPPSVGATTVVFPVASCTTCTSAFETGKSIGVREARYPPSLTTFAIRVGAPFFHRGLAINDVEALLSYKQRDLIEFLLRVLSSYKTRIERSLRPVRHHVLRLLAHVRAAQSAYI